MDASVLTGIAKSDKMGDVIRFCNKSVLPTMKEQAGFKGAILLCNHDIRQFVLISLWDDLSSLLTAEASAYLQAQFREMRVILERPLVAEHYVVNT